MTNSLKIVRFHFDENGGAKPSAKCEATLRIKISQILIFDATLSIITCSYMMRRR
jgi:hypothetical protein